MASEKEGQQPITKAASLIFADWFLERHVGVAAIKELAQIGAGKPDAMAFSFVIQEAHDFLQSIVRESTEALTVQRIVGNS
jgi:hypothetical protein